MEKEILKLHKNGLTNRSIAKEVGCHHTTVGAYLKKNKLKSNGNCRVKLDRVSLNSIRCSKCKIIKNDKQFLFNRKGQKYEYKFTYCLACRRKQLEDNLNSDVNKYLSDRYNRLKLRSKKLNIPFNLTKKYFINLYSEQSGLCFYTDTKLICRVGQGKHRHSLSIDKIISHKGYVKGNVVFCTHQANTAKTDFTLEEMQKWMKPWYDRIQCFQVDYGNF